MAFGRYQRAAELKYVPSYVYLGRMYLSGQGVAADSKRAVALFKDAARANDSAAMFILGELYEAGQGVDRNEAIAKEYYKLAAERGSEDAKKKLAALN